MPRALPKKYAIGCSLLLFLILLGGFLYRAHASHHHLPQFELQYRLPKDWKMALRGELRDKLIKKYTNKHESIFMWTSKLEVTHYYHREIADLNKFLKDWKFDLKELCDASNVITDPGLA